MNSLLQETFGLRIQNKLILVLGPKKAASNTGSYFTSIQYFLLSTLGIPAVDPVLKRAQFNQKVINMTQHEEANRVRMSKRPVSMETRRFAGKYLNRFLSAVCLLPVKM